MRLNRRFFLAAAGAGVLPSILRTADLSKMIVRSGRPEDLEMPLDGFNEWITPADRFFVRCHTYVPDRANLTDWKLKLDGVVNQSLTLSMEDLKKLPRVEFAAVLECAGNGRSFYQPRVAGTQWDFGSVGNGRWAGVRFRDVLAKAGLKDSAKEILLDGADVPLGTMPKFQRTIPVNKALDPDTLLVYEMNGQPLPVEHGFPLRLIAPGWAGDSWVKWLQHIEVLDHEFEGFWMKTAYRRPVHHVEPGATVDPAQMVPVTDLNVKSVIASEGYFVKPGRVRTLGVAWSNSSPVTHVDVSVDGGQTWKAAKLGKDQSRYAWRLWELEWRADKGKHTLIARATNAAGQSQPLTEEWNPSGYLWNVAQPVEIIAGGAASDVELKPPPPPPTHPHGYDAACLTCHDERMMVQQRLTPAQWDREVNKMTGWGAKIPVEDRPAILKYLTDNFKP
jgi:DMSO/TMAO reductase YedYZ molybdopterin-dependent catalytic subunit